MSQPERIAYFQASCGCEFWNQGPDGVEFVIRPHSLDCEIYRYAMEESRRQGNQPEFRLE